MPWPLPGTALQTSLAEPLDPLDHGSDHLIGKPASVALGSGAKVLSLGSKRA